ncbi:hypothetical protein ACFV27_31305 [Streptomyces antimycoticus]|nr:MULTISPECIES: hypothetical protein [Streptomyces]MEE4582222.1 hypothetical protein [Streptomyces sp. DSM 41602]AJZ83559.1 hypothetical protein AS97_13855 [Streptomyces sp. AgN23]KUL48755.1 hypothetical protein ADL28_28075 [Streptomyces violaceusniger]MCG0287017.1 NaeI family type II restriction endonuclease [Streptomyces sp. PSAA01]RSS32750.1 hypothetical protein EF902_45380 [Streptomyces sp. WAC05858]
MSATWWLMQGEAAVGELRQYGVDQPVFLCHFTPGPAWEAVRAHFEAWSALRGPDPDGSRTAQVIRSIMDLGLRLVPTDDSPSMTLFTECILRIDGHTARLRC